MPRQKRERDMSLFADVKVGDVVYTNPSERDRGAMRHKFTVTSVSPQQFKTGNNQSWWKDGWSAEGYSRRIHPATPELESKYKEWVDFNKRKLNDGERFATVMKCVVGRRLTFRQLCMIGGCGFMGIE